MIKNFQFLIIGISIPWLMSMMVNRYDNREETTTLQFIEAHPSYLGFIGTNVKLECLLKGVMTEWVIVREKKSNFMAFDEFFGSLDIENSTKKDTARYICKNSDGYGKSESMNVSVKFIDPKVSNTNCRLITIDNKHRGMCFMNDKSDDEIRVKVGSDVMLDCEVVLRMHDKKLSTGASYEWSFTPMHKSSVTSVIMQKPSKVSKIIIKNLLKNYGGDYSCVVTLKTKTKVLKLKKNFNVQAFARQQIMGSKSTQLTTTGRLQTKYRCKGYNEFNQCNNIRWAVVFAKSFLVPDEFVEFISLKGDKYYTFSTSKTENEINSYSDMYFISIFYKSNLDSSMVSLMCICANDHLNYHIFQLSQSSTLSPRKPTVSSNRLEFNLYSSTEPRRKAPLIIVYILMPAFVILIALTCIIFCCIRHTRNNMLQYRQNHTSSTIVKPLYNQPNQPYPTHFMHNSVGAGGSGSNSNSYCTTNNV